MTAMRDWLIWYAVIVLGAVGAACHAALSDLTSITMVWGASLVASGLIVAFFADEKFDAFSPMFFIGFTFAILYGAGAIILASADEGELGSLNRDLLPYMPTAAAATFLALVGLLAGYRFASRWSLASLPLRISEPEHALKLVWVITFSMGVVAFLLLLRSNVYLQVTTDLETPLFYSSVGFLQQGFMLSVPLAVTAALTRQTLYWRLAAVITVTMILLFGIPSGSKTLALLGFVLTALGWNYGRKRFSRTQAFLGAAVLLGVLLVLLPLNLAYRTILLDSDEGRQQTLRGSFSTLVDATSNVLSEDTDKVLDQALDYGASRLSNISVVANILRYQDDGGPLEYGSTYARLFYVLIPRVIWPEKPALAIGRALAVKLGYAMPETVVLGEELSTTSVGVTLVGEFVLNFPWYLAFAGMFFVGCLYRFLYGTLMNIRAVAPAVAVGVYGSVWYTTVFTAHESNFAGWAAGAIKTLAFFALLLYLSGIGRQRAGAPVAAAK